jgi:hypothetical protein
MLLSAGSYLLVAEPHMRVCVRYLFAFHQFLLLCVYCLQR